jgi:hypothetical protein
LEADNPPRSDLTRTYWFGHRNFGSVATVPDLKEVLVAEVDVEAMA